MFIFIFLYTVLLKSNILYANTIVQPVDQQFYIHNLNPNNTVSISNSKIIQWQDFGSKLKLRSLKEGETQLRVKNKTYKIKILSKNQYLFYKDLSVSLTKKMGLFVEIHDNSILIKGQLHRIKDWTSIARIADKHNGSYLFKAKIDQDIQQNLNKYFNEKLLNHQHQITQLKWKPVPTLHLSNFKSASVLKNNFLKYGFSIKELIGNKRPLSLHLYFIDISKSLQDQFGLNWDGQFKANILPKFFDLSLLDTSLSHSKSKGQFKVIHSIKLLCSDQTECEMQEGGEIPVKTHSFSTSKIHWKNYGLSIKFTPNFTPLNKINLKLNYKISAPDFAEHADGVPSFKTKKINTEFTTENNQYVYVGGLNIDSTGSNSTGRLPFISIPLLDRLINNNYQTSRKMNTYLFIKVSHITEANNYD